MLRTAITNLSITVLTDMRITAVTDMLYTLLIDMLNLLNWQVKDGVLKLGDTLYGLMVRIWVDRQRDRETG